MQIRAGKKKFLMTKLLMDDFREESACQICICWLLRSANKQMQVQEHQRILPDRETPTAVVSASYLVQVPHRAPDVMQNPSQLHLGAGGGVAWHGGRGHVAIGEGMAAVGGAG